MHQVTLPLAFLAMSGVTVLALLPTPATVLPVLPPPLLPQPAAIAAQASIAPALASFLFKISLLVWEHAERGAPPGVLTKPSSGQYPARRTANRPRVLRGDLVPFRPRYSPSTLMISRLSLCPSNSQ